MVEHDGRIGERPREIGEIGKLRLQEPGVEREAKTMQHREAFTEVSIPIETGRYAPRQRAEHLGVRVP